ncbi:MAG: glycerol dehydrogenase [Halioglobus sp.]
MNSKSQLEYTSPEPFADSISKPRIFGSPGRYVQGDGVIDQAGHYLSRLGFQRSLVLLSARCLQAEGRRLIDSMQKAGLQFELAQFGGECSLQEISMHLEAASALDNPVSSVVAVGGGKVVDAGRALAQRLGVPVAVIPTLASNDAPTAAVSVIYTPEGVTADAEVYDLNPALVLVDTGVVAAAGSRYLSAGMGDGLATWYEARACAATSTGVNVFGARPTLAGTALAKLCADTIFQQGIDAMAAVRASKVNVALEDVVEANTLLSGLGYESGGLAVAHAIAQGYTVIEKVHRDHLHGEMVAMGIMTQLALEQADEELDQAARFFLAVGLPVHLGQLGLSASDSNELQAIVDGAMAFPFIVNMTETVTSASLLDAVLRADQYGRRLQADSNG